jgi:hypothetical protein
MNASPDGSPHDAPPAQSESSEYCGPDQLCGVLMKLRRFGKSPELEGAISEQGVRRLLDVAFQVSLTTEEGRHPRFRVFVGSRGGEGMGTPLPVVRFDPPLPFNDHLLRRLAPSVGSRGHALRVVEEGKRLFADSVIGVMDSTDSVATGSHELSTGLGFPGLMVRVDGPGILRATELEQWELRAGRIQKVRHYAIVSIVRKWFEELAGTFLEQTSAMSIADMAEQADRGDAASIFDAVWSFVLSTTIGVQHGGAFVVLPVDVSRAPVHVTYPAERLDLMRAALSFWEACYDPDAVGNGADVRSRAQAWEAARRRMFSAARALADLANVDGCVTLDRRLRLYGFGGEIRVNESDVAGFRVFAADPETLAEQEPIEIERFGTRHRSATRLCAAVPGTLAFVISQDGDLRVFYGLPERRVCMWRNLGAWMSASERW